MEVATLRERLLNTTTLHEQVYENKNNPTKILACLPSAYRRHFSVVVAGKKTNLGSFSQRVSGRTFEWLLWEPLRKDKCWRRRQFWGRRQWCSSSQNHLRKPWKWWNWRAVEHKHFLSQPGTAIVLDRRLNQRFLTLWHNLMWASRLPKQTFHSGNI